MNKPKRLNKEEVIKQNEEFFKTIMVTPDVTFLGFITDFNEEYKDLKNGIGILANDLMNEESKNKELKDINNKLYKGINQLKEHYEKIVEQNQEMKKELNRILLETEDEKIDEGFKQGKYKQLLMEFNK